MEYYKGLIGILIIANIIISAYISYTEVSGNIPICLTGKGCETVQNSPYSTIMGIKLGFIGIISFSALLIVLLLVSYKKAPIKLFFIATIIGLIGAIYFMSIQFFILKTVCSNCLGTEIIMLAISLIAFKKRKKLFN